MQEVHCFYWCWLCRAFGQCFRRHTGYQTLRLTEKISEFREGAAGLLVEFELVVGELELRYTETRT